MSDELKANKIQHPKKRAFLAAYAQVGSVSRAAIHAEIDRCTHYAWVRAEGQDGDDYRAAFAEAQEIAADELETEALRRAKEGVRRLKFHEGQPVIDPETGEPYVEHQYSDTLAIFLLKGLKPEKYRERTDAKISGELNHTGNVQIYIPDNKRQVNRIASVNGNGSHNGNGNGKHH